MAGTSTSNIGRPTLCTPEVIATVARHIADGLPKRHAYVFAGISEQAACEWLKRGADGEQPFADFAESCARARAQHVQTRISRIQAAATGDAEHGPDWKAEAWLLEKLEPADFGRTRVEVTGADGAPVQVAASVVLVPMNAATAEDWQSSVAADVHKPLDPEA